jgi:hypothetical protein
MSRSRSRSPAPTELDVESIADTVPDSIDPADPNDGLEDQDDEYGFFSKEREKAEVEQQMRAGDAHFRRTITGNHIYDTNIYIYIYIKHILWKELYTYVYGIYQLNCRRALSLSLSLYIYAGKLHWNTTVVYKLNWNTGDR